MITKEEINKIKLCITTYTSIVPGAEGLSEHVKKILEYIDQLEAGNAKLRQVRAMAHLDESGNLERIEYIGVSEVEREAARRMIPIVAKYYGGPSELIDGCSSCKHIEEKWMKEWEEKK